MHWPLSASQVTPWTPSQKNSFSSVPLSLHTLETSPSQEASLGTQMTQPSPSTQSPSHGVTSVKPPMPSQVLALLSSQTIVPASQGSPVVLVDSATPVLL